ncbi:helix-turn-helix domain-containing protein [Soonwooa sp.]|uniref:helix-turn-helix domain-containing protein n=1 Tax=Soonwooa sp. TaxID=1938592 RepID=UPI00262E285C|nr:helix-turn-helix domain-containing protein [Soonwooa sp.]
MQNNNHSPNYNKIYSDLIQHKFPERISEFSSIFNGKQRLSTFDVITLNQKLFGKIDDDTNQKLRSYSKNDIIEILNYQKKNNMNNSEMANYFKISRNSIAKWKKLFLV